jgi:hypothetical protein
MDHDAEKIALADVLELDRRAWNLPRPVKPPQNPQAPFSVQSGREDKSEPEPEAA